MFSPSAHLYDLLYGFKDYAAESAYVADAALALAPEAASLLDVACGTGKHLVHLRERFAHVEGLDLDASLLAGAAERLPGVPLHEADMVEFDLGRRFDVVTTLFSAIGYVRRPHYLARAARSLAAHVEPGGVLVVEPWLRPEEWRTGHLSFTEAGGEDERVVRMGIAEREGDVSILRMQILWGRAGGEVEHLVEEHRLGLFEDRHYRAAFEAAGLTVEHDPEGPTGRGLWLAVKPRA